MTIRVVPSTVFKQLVYLNRDITKENLKMSYLLRGRYVKIDFTVLDYTSGILLAVIPSLPVGSYPYYIKKADIIYESGTIVSESITASTLSLGETSTTAYRGDRGKTAYDHSQSAHAPSDAQKNSDITKSEIETVLTGPITSHTHSYLSTMDVGVVVDGGSSVITTGTKGYRRIAGTWTITGWDIVSDVTGSCVVDVLLTTYSTFPTSSSIAGSNKPTLSSAQKGTGDVTTWTDTTIADGDILEFKVDSASTVKKIHLFIHLTKI